MKRDFKVLVHRKQNVSQQLTSAQASQRANHMLGCTRPIMATRRGKGLSPLLCTMQPHFLHWQDIKLLQSIQRKSDDGGGSGGQDMRGVADVPGFAQC